MKLETPSPDHEVKDVSQLTTYGTSDYCLATTLLCLGFQIELADYSSPNRVAFEFSGEKIYLAAISYFQHKVTVKPQEFFFAQKQIKSMINDYKNILNQ